MNAKVLVVEDEVKLAQLLHDYLLREQMTVTTVYDGGEVMQVLESHAVDIILLDLMLPNKDGLSLCREIRQHPELKHIPIIMTTARVDEIDRLLGLEIGADDYVCKPYSPREVVARVKAVLRRLNQHESAPTRGLALDDDKMKAQLHDNDLMLTAVEYSLLKLMAQTPGKIFSRSQLMDNMYSDYRVVSERTIDSHIKKLRQKIAAIKPETELIHSVYGVGYKVELSES